MTNSKNKLIKNTIIYAIGDIIPKIISFLIFPVMTTYLVPSDYGIINYVNTLNAFMIIVGVLCLNTYYLVYYYKQNNEEEKRKLLGNLSIFILGLNLIISVVICVVGCYSPFFLSENIPFYPYIFLGVISNFFNIITILPTALYRLKENPLPLTILNVLKSISIAILNILMVVVFKESALGVLLSTTLVNVVFGILFLFITIRNSSLYFNFSTIKVALKFSLPLLPGSLSYYLMNMSDRILIERYLDLSQLGIYSTASTLAMIIQMVSYGAYKAIEPYFFKEIDSSNFNKKFNSVRDIYIGSLLVVTAIVAIFSQDFFKIFANENYQTVYLYVPMVQIGVLFASCSTMYSTVMTAKGKTNQNSLVAIIGGLCSLICNLLLLPRVGLYGASISSALSFLIILSLSVAYSGMKDDMMKLIWAGLVTELITILTVYVLDINSLAMSVIVRFSIICVIIFSIIRILKINFKKL